METLLRFFPSPEHVTTAFFTWLTTIAAHAELRRAWLARIRKLERKVFGRAEDDPPVEPLAVK